VSSVLVCLSPSRSLDVFCSFHWAPGHRDLHSFPTRRSSDLSRKEHVGRRLCDLELDRRFQAQVTRLRRADLDMIPSDDTRLELGDRKSTRLNSSHVKISYAVFCLKKKRRRTAQNTE